MNCPKCNEPRILLLTSYACGCGRPKVESKASQEPVLLTELDAVMDAFRSGRVLRATIQAMPDVLHYHQKTVGDHYMTYQHGSWLARLSPFCPVMGHVTWHLMPEGFEP